jgi:hypothetical protein
MSFHVPESARDTTHPLLGSTAADGNNGAFHLESPEPGWMLALICSDGTEPDTPPDGEWEHVSVHAYRARQSDVVGLLGRAESVPKMRTPTWKEMAFVKGICWDDEDVVMQLHPRKSQYINYHPFTLHLWRPRRATIPEPPAMLVGPMNA